MTRKKQQVPGTPDDATVMAQWAKVTDPREALHIICEQQDFLGYDSYYKDLRNALLDMAERCSAAPASTTIYVIMGNDYPSAVFASEERAEAYCDVRKKARKPSDMGPRIYWRWYKFPVDVEQ